VPCIRDIAVIRTGPRSDGPAEDAVGLAGAIYETSTMLAAPPCFGTATSTSPHGCRREQDSGFVVAITSSLSRLGLERD